MGFRVEVDEDSQALLDRIRTHPGMVFDRPYKGYLLFLAGAADKSAVEWIASNSLALDSLTGEDVAFAVFVRRFKMKLITGHRTWTKKRFLGEIPIEGDLKIHRISELIKSGQWGWVADGDEIAAVTYAVDRIARGLNILDKLPCVVVLDAVPSNRINVIPLSEATRASFIELLRRALSKLLRMKGCELIESSVQRLTNLHGAIDRPSRLRLSTKQSLRIAKRDLERATLSHPTFPEEPEKISVNISSGILTTISRQWMEAAEALRNGSLPEFRRALSGRSGREKYKSKKMCQLPGLRVQDFRSVFQHAECHSLELLQLNTAIQYCQAKRLTTGTEKENHIGDFVREQILSTSRSRDLKLDNKGEVERSPESLEGRRETIIDDIMSRVPSEESLRRNIIEIRKDRALQKWQNELAEYEERTAKHMKNLDALKQKVATIERQLSSLSPERTEELTQEAAAKYEAAVRDYLAESPPSFWEAVSDSLREMKLEHYSSSIPVRAAEIAGGIFKPDFLLKFWQTAAG